MNALERNRTITLVIRGVQIQIPVKDPTTEWDLRLQACIKNHALGTKGGLEPLLWEKWLMQFDADEVCKVPREHLAPMIAARNCAKEMLAEVELECFADIQKVTLSITLTSHISDPCLQTSDT